MSKIKSLLIEPSERKDKRLKAIYTFDNGKTKTINFGMKGSKGTYYDIRDSNKKKAYISRHIVNENWSKEGILTAGFLSRWVLWYSDDIEDVYNKLVNMLGTKEIFLDIPKYVL